MKNLSIFQIVIFAIICVLIVTGVIMFATVQKKAIDGVPLVTVWGVVDAGVINSLVTIIDERKPDSINLAYTKFDAQTLESELLEALAEGRGPDLVILPLADISKQEGRLKIIPFESYSERSFKDIFIEEGELLLKKEGIVAFPFMVDPLVLYWNRDTFTNAGIARPPAFWDQVLAITPTLVEKDDDFNVFKSAVALGEFRNVNNAKGILSTLLLQAGTPIIVRSDGENRFNVVMNEPYDFKIRPAEAALSFFTQFANPVQDAYTWNRALPNSQDMFVAGDLAMYIGYASEYSLIQKRNPNLNFDISMMPSSRSGTTDIYSNMYAISLTNQTQNVGPAFSALLSLIDFDTIKELEEITFLPPVRRDVLSRGSSDDVMSVFYNSALKAKGVLEFDSSETDRIYRDMVESFTSGRVDLGSAVDKANAELKILIR